MSQLTQEISPPVSLHIPLAVLASQRRPGSPLCTHLQQHLQRQPLLRAGSCKQELPQEELHEHPQLFPCGVGLGRSLQTLHNAVTFSLGPRAAGIPGGLSGAPLKDKKTPV